MSPPGSDVVVLAYHAISPSWPVDTTVRPDRLEQQLSLLVGRGYRGITFTEAVLCPPPRRSMAITFDDASESVLSLALPILERLGLVATVFVPTAYPESGRPLAWAGQERWLDTEYESELACMSWSGLGELLARGWEIGSHSCSHPRLTALDDDTLHTELTESRAELERRLGRPCTSLAYPYGDYDERVVQATRRAGYAAAATVPRGPAAPTQLEWPRVGVYRGDTAQRLRMRIWRRGPLSRSAAGRPVERVLGSIRS